MTGSGLGVLLACFGGRARAKQARRGLESQLRSGGDRVFDVVVARVDARGRAAVYEPRREVAGALTAALTWGLFGAATGGGVAGLVVWAVVGGVWGAAFAVARERVLGTDPL